MSNRETYPASQSPLQGDISGPAGATQIVVTGLQTIPVSSATPDPQDDLVYDGTQWAPTPDANVAISFGTFESTGGQIVSKGVPLSDDYDIFVNATFVKVNGVIVAP